MFIKFTELLSNVLEIDKNEISQLFITSSIPLFKQDRKKEYILKQTTVSSVTHLLVNCRKCCDKETTTQA